MSRGIEMNGLIYHAEAICKSLKFYLYRSWKQNVPLLFTYEHKVSRRVLLISSCIIVTRLPPRHPLLVRGESIVSTGQVNKASGLLEDHAALLVLFHSVEVQKPDLDPLNSRFAIHCFVEKNLGGISEEKFKFLM